MSNFSDRALAWFDRHGRNDLPWQQADAYGVWVSEIMLQQTQVQTAIPYYERFMQVFPSVIALADADLDTVLRYWSGLGYYARARNLHSAARIIRDDHGGTFPSSFDEVAKLPGIGRSTAGAILSLAFETRHPILDGNVRRVLARHLAIAGWPGKSAVAQRLWEAAELHTPKAGIAAYTQAIMDLGATVCTRRNPHCDVCPVSEDCQARETGTIDQYPARKPKKTKPLRQTTMVLAVSEDAIYLERRPPAGIWGGLCTLRHSFSHYDLDIQPVVVRIESSSRKVADGGDATWHRLDDSPPGGIAAPVQKLINTLKTGGHVQNS